MNYQYRYGTTTTEAIETLYADGGWTRYYQGLVAALVQGPVSRFGDTAANAGILALLESNTFMNKLPTLIKTVFASVAAACFRMILTPVDTIKTTMQTEGKGGIALLRARVRPKPVGVMLSHAHRSFVSRSKNMALVLFGTAPWRRQRPHSWVIILYVHSLFALSSGSTRLV